MQKYYTCTKIVIFHDFSKNMCTFSQIHVHFLATLQILAIHFDTNSTLAAKISKKHIFT